MLTPQKITLKLCQLEPCERDIDLINEMGMRATLFREWRILLNEQCQIQRRIGLDITGYEDTYRILKLEIGADSEEIDLHQQGYRETETQYTTLRAVGHKYESQMDPEASPPDT